MTDPIARLEHAIAQLGAEHEPPAGWEARVLEAVEGRRRRRRWALPLALAALALGVVLAWWGWPRRDALTLVVELTRGPERGRDRSSSPGALAPGAQLHAVVRGGEGDRAIRVYRDGGALVTACPGQARCRHAGDALSLSLTLERAGRYLVVALSSARALPANAGTYEVDLAAVIEAGATWQQRELVVR